MWLGSNQVRVCMNAHAQSHTHAHVHMPDLYNSAGFPWGRSLVGTVVQVLQSFQPLGAQSRGAELWAGWSLWPAERFGPPHSP